MEDLCEDCREQHKQLAGWLSELREARAERMPHGRWSYRGFEKGASARTAVADS